MADESEGGRGKEFRTRTAGAFRYFEYFLYILVAGALSLVGAILFGNAVYTFVSGVGNESVSTLVLGLLDQLLLVFIVTELLHTVRAIITERVLLTEPFLIVGVVAAIRRLIVISAEVSRYLGTPEFASLMIEVGVLVGAATALGFTIFLLRHTEHSEPRPQQ